MAIKPYLQLVRLPNLFTAAADSLAGWILATGSLARPHLWLPLTSISVCLYAAGIVLNDVFDYETDLRERPNRPLPSGKVPYRFGVAVGAGGIAVATMIAVSSGHWGTLGVTFALILCILLYNAGLKRTIFGPTVMGACRSFNLLLGFSQLPDIGGPAAWGAAISFGIFVMGITWISRSEVVQGGFWGIAFGLFWQDIGLLGLTGLALSPRLFPDVDVPSPIIPIEGLLILLVTAFFVNRATGRALRELSPEWTQKAVKTGVLSLVWLDFGLVAAVRGPKEAIPVFLLWVPAYLIAKWLYTT